MSAAAVATFDAAAAVSAADLALRHPHLLPVRCVAATGAKRAAHGLLVPRTATVAHLQQQLRDALGAGSAAAHVFVDGAAPDPATAVADLAASYAAPTDGILHVVYTTESAYGVFTVPGFGFCGGSGVPDYPSVDVPSWE